MNFKLFFFFAAVLFMAFSVEDAAAGELIVFLMKDKNPS